MKRKLSAVCNPVRNCPEEVTHCANLCVGIKFLCSLLVSNCDILSHLLEETC